MKLFQCQHCGQLLHFENTACLGCGRRLGYLTDCGTLSAVEPDGSAWRAYANTERNYRFCANWERSACNWMVPADGDDVFCRACRHNRTIPDISDPLNHAHWQKIEEAKRRLFYTLIKLDLPLPTAASGAAAPLVFDFLADDPASGARIVTGHDSGLITIALAEADDARREAMRTSMNEPYRTLLGHFRHEVGHFYWDRLVRDDAAALEQFRILFGDERADYAQAMQHHYDNGAPADWRTGHISAYATMHPWEDWAETWAHYLHMVDALEMAGAFNMSLRPEIAGHHGETSVDFDPHHVDDLDVLVDAWRPLTIAVNALNRTLGQPDLYPFVLTPPVIEKMRFIHKLVQEQAARSSVNAAA